MLKDQFFFFSVKSNALVDIEEKKTRTVSLKNTTASKT